MICDFHFSPYMPSYHEHNNAFWVLHRASWQFFFCVSEEMLLQRCICRIYLYLIFDNEKRCGCASVVAVVIWYVQQPFLIIISIIQIIQGEGMMMMMIKLMITFEQIDKWQKVGQHLHEHLRFYFCIMNIIMMYVMLIYACMAVVIKCNVWDF